MRTQAYVERNYIASLLLVMENLLQVHYSFNAVINRGLCYVELGYKVIINITHFIVHELNVWIS